MSTTPPPRMNDHVSLARHRPHPPHSPFGRAGDPSHEFEFDFDANFASPSKQNGTRPRHNYRTGTLAGAYRAVSRTSMSDEGAQMGSTPSPRRTWNYVNKLSPASNNSNPPEELVDTYRRIEEDGTLSNYVQWDDPENSSGKRSSGRPSRSPSRQREREYNEGFRDGNAFSDAGLFDDAIYKSPRRATDYSRDEQRLRRVTGKDSPVFSKAKTNSRTALTADNLQRREEQQQRQESNHRSNQEQQPVSDYEGDRGVSLNLPRTWGSRAARRQEWLRNVSGSSTSEPQERENPDVANEAPVSKLDTHENHTSRPSRQSSHIEQASAPGWDDREERVANHRTQNTERTNEQSGLGLDNNALQSDGAAIPNTPIVVYKSSSLNRPSATKRDSQDLLRRLSRTESPKLDQIQTPDPPKLFERKIYDKTPRVTGAWIDTPMTERVVEIPSDLTKDIVPVAPPIQKEDSTVQAPPAVVVESKAAQKESSEVKDEKISPEQPVIKQSKPRPPLARPKLPKSALETVIEDASSGKETLDLGDDTIESLQAMLEDQTEMKTEEEEEAAFEQKVLDRLELARQNSESPEDYNRIETKLQSLTKHITEVRKGLDRLQGQVTNGIGSVDKKEDTVKKSPSTPASTISESCKTCSVPPNNRVYAVIPLPRLWERSPISRRIRVTKLGWSLIALVIWYIIECDMVLRYAHVVVWNKYCTGNCVRPNAPSFPFVTVTMLWRWSRIETLLAPIFTLAIALFRLVLQLLGLWDGYVEEQPSLPRNIVGRIIVNGTSVSFPWLTPPSETQATSATSVLPPAPSPPVWTPSNDAPVQGQDDEGSMDDDEYV